MKIAMTRGTGGRPQGWFLALMLIGGAWLSPRGASAAEPTFIGVGAPSYTGSWHIASYWSLGSVPTNTDGAKINRANSIANITDNGAVAVYVSLSETAAYTTMLNLASGSLAVGGNMTVGYFGRGTVVQSGADLSVAGNLVLGGYAGSFGIYTQTAGSVDCKGAFNVGGNAASEGFCHLQGGTMVLTGNVWVGYSGIGRFRQYGGQVTAANYGVTALTVGGSGTGTYELVSGMLINRDQAYVGRSAGGNGTFLQTGGTNQMTAARDLYIGGGSNSVGTYTLAGGTLLSTNGAKIYVAYYAGSSNATFNLNTNSSGTGAIVGNASVYVANFADNTFGTFRGFGLVSGGIANSGRVIADGYGADRTLEFTGVFDNPWDNGTSESNGWFAQKGGKLALKPIDISAGIHTYYWAENGDLDMVNAFRLDMVTGHPSAATNLVAALLATDRTDAGLDTVRSAIGLWEISCTALAAYGGTLTFRYDHAAAAAKGVAESDIRVFQGTGGRWRDVTGSVNTSLKTITTQPLNSLGKFALGTPGAGSVLNVR